MRLKGNILTSFQYKHPQKTSASFFRNVQVSLTAAIIVSFLFIGSIVFLRQYLDVRHQLEAQGIVLSSNLAYNAEPFIVDYNKDQLNVFLDAMLENPLVLFSGIINTRFSGPTIDVLKKQSTINLKFVTEVIRQPRYGKLQEALSLEINRNDSNIKDVIYCISPIMSDFKFPDDETTLLYDQPKHKGIIGYSVIAYRMPWEQLFSVKIQWVIGVFIGLSLLLGWLLGRRIASKFTKRIQNIYTSIQSYSFGDSIDLNDTYGDEISDIANAVKGLTEQVSIQLGKITDANKTLEQKVSDRTQELQDLNKSITIFNQNQRAFIGQTAQELKTLMSILPLIKNNSKAHGQLLAHVSVFLERLLQMIRQNKEFSGLGAIEKVNLKALFNELSPLFHALSETNANNYQIECNDNPIIETDRMQLTQAIIQLMQNASKYTREGTIKWTISSSNHHAFIKCEDTGMGMDQDRVNEVLTQLDRNNMRLFDAFTTLGIGLVLTHRFCRNIQAKLLCLSELNKGTSIEIVHPITFDHEGPMSKSVICISDDPVATLQMKISLQSLGLDGYALSEIAIEKHAKPIAFMIDFSNVAKGIASFNHIWNEFPGSDICCVVHGTLIHVHFLAEYIPPYIGTVIQNLCGDEGHVLQSGLSKRDQAVCREQLGDRLSNYKYNQKVAARIVSCDRYEPKLTNAPVILIYESDDKLLSLIQNKGCSLNQLGQLLLFKNRGV